MLASVGDVVHCGKPSYVQLSPLYLLSTLDVTHVIKFTRLSPRFFMRAKGHAINLRSQGRAWDRNPWLCKDQIGYSPDDWPLYKTALCTLDNGTPTHMHMPQACTCTCTPPLFLIKGTPRHQSHVQHKWVSRHCYG